MAGIVDEARINRKDFLLFSDGIKEVAGPMFEMGKGGEGGVCSRKLVSIDPVEEGVGVFPVSVEGIADPEDVGIVFFSEGMDLLVHEAKRVDERRD